MITKLLACVIRMFSAAMKWAAAKGKGMTIPKLKWILGPAAGVGIGWLSVTLNYHGVLPLPHHWVVFLSPIVTLIVAVMTFWEHLFDEEVIDTPRSDHVRAACFIGLLFTCFVCFALTVLHGWERHLLLLFTLFGGFIGWDIWMLFAIKNEKHRNQIAIANRLVNRPTIIAILAVLVFLKSNAFDSLILNSKGSGFSSAQEAFAMGLISFHLVVSAVGYAGSILEVKASSRRPLRLLGTVLNRVPNGPPKTTG